MLIPLGIISIYLLRLKYKTNLIQLNLPSYSFRIKQQEGAEMIFDPIRKKYVRLTPEEWVRQNFIQYLVNEGSYPAGLIAVEHRFIQNKLSRRIDILVHDRRGKPVMMVECKSPETAISEVVFDQIVRYNMELKLPYIVVTNGMINYACKVDHINNRFEYLMVIPLYEEIQE